jgi:hypothetical protein
VTGGFRSVDVAKITCKQFITYEITDDARTLSLWLAGYWNGQQKIPSSMSAAFAGDPTP